MRRIAAATVLALVIGCTDERVCVPSGCSPSDGAIDSDASRLDAGVVDASAIVDAATGTDAHATPDARTDLADASGSTDAGAPPDASERDASADAGRGYDGECSVVPQSGCGAGEACILVRQAGWSFESGCVDRSRGVLYDGQFFPAPNNTCRGQLTDGTRYDGCAPGLFCGSSGCVRYCVIGGPPEQCPPLRGEFPTECREIDADRHFPVGYCTWVDAP